VTALVRACAIGLGSNLGPSAQYLTQALQQLDRHPHLAHLRVAPLYRTVPIGPPQPDYLNTAATFTTTLDPWQLLELLQQLEADAGRTRTVPWGARTLDLDLLLYGAWQICSPRLQVPHPYLQERAFVLVPLADIAPDWRWGSWSIAQLRSAVDCSGVVPLVERCPSETNPPK
jgi:2-amino-4-hydroxy-6-hydroxymethyldihydropteridine diphosphokinase